LHEIATRIGEVIDEHSPDCVVVEEAFSREAFARRWWLGHVRGALLVIAVQRGATVAEFSPSEIKLSVAGSGAADKTHGRFMVRRLLGLRGTSSRTADALAAAICT